MPRRLPALLLALLALAGTARAADPSADFAEANRLFEKGDFPQAAAAYEKLVSEGRLSSDLFYNLGATQHKLGQTGEAVLWMRRALAIEPGMPEARQSLAFLRDRIGFLEFAEGRIDRYLSALPPSFGPWAVSLGIWIGGLSVASAFWVPRLRPNRPALIALGAVAFIAAFAAHRADTYRAERIAVENFATVVEAGTSASTAPVPDAKSVIEIPPGSEVRILLSIAPWSYIEIPGDLRGWVRSEAIRPVWPIPSSATAP